MATAAELHQRLVDQLAGKGLLDSSRRRAAFGAVRRAHFLPGVDLERSYRDEAVTTQVGPGGRVTSSSSQPSMMAMMLAQLDPQPGDHVLEIGAGTGYNAALLAQLVGRRERRGCLFEVPSANRTKPGRMAGLRCFRVMPLPEAHGAIVLSVGRLLPQRLRLSRRVWDAGE